jgi:hypothetical protein
MPDGRQDHAKTASQDRRPRARRLRTLLISRSSGSARPPVGSMPAGNLLAALPANNGMAFILVQHLDPTHESMMVDLLASHSQ